MEASCTVQTLRNSCKFFSESDKERLAKAISKNQVSDPGPSWPSCLCLMVGKVGGKKIKRRYKNFQIKHYSVFWGLQASGINREHESVFSPDVLDDSLLWRGMSAGTKCSFGF